MSGKVLENITYNIIKDKSLKGECYFEEGKYAEAIGQYQEALSIVPDPKTEWEAAKWLYTAIGDSFFALKNYEYALKNFYDASYCVEGDKNPFINLRIGQCLFEMKDNEKADDYFLKAYLFDGLKIFKNERKKYLSYLQKKYDL
ncbi:tetratricopeptide repeat protein [uncultured Kriegella sp.]|uniref:tetratricopeptide repeat protein n=1 Tax=uncultured Kriegella sp. TaxID=1798910 RepID=UPI0030D77B83|tara:strand:+ start:364727 stop:365158 length:432 start_codon:yes stop_codon:yes gene_type:complete